jgi:hypothetical protein
MPMMKMTLKGKYTYEKDEELEGDACARLKLEGELLMEAGDVEDEAGENPEVAQARAALKAFGLKLGESKIEGVSHYSYAMSNIRRSTVELKMTMSMKDPTTQENMVMPIETKVLSTLKMQDGGK